MTIPMSISLLSETALRGEDFIMAGEERALDRELAFYRSHLREWEGREGEYILIKDEAVAGFFSSYDDALRQGYQRFGLQPFLVKQISTVERAHFISRSIQPCLTSHYQ